MSFNNVVISYYQIKIEIVNYKSYLNRESGLINTRSKELLNYDIKQINKKINTLINHIEMSNNLILKLYRKKTKKIIDQTLFQNVVFRISI